MGAAGTAVCGAHARAASGWRRARAHRRAPARAAVSALRPPPPIAEFYFAYGANVDVATLERRMGDEARAVSAHASVLRGYELRFDVPGLPYSEPAFASVAECAGASAHGVVYGLSEGAERTVRAR